MRRTLFELPDDGSHGRTHGPAAYGLAALGFLAGWLVLSWPWLSGRVTIPWDAKAGFLPQIQFLAGSIARGESPFWNPYVFSGYPQIADPQSMIFSPLLLALAALNPAPSPWAVDVAVFAAILIGGLALMVWFYDRDFHPAGALIAALVFGFGAAMAWRIQHIGQVLSLAQLPVVLVLLDRTLARGSWVYGFVAGVTAGLMVLSRDQVALLSVYLLTGLTLWRLAGAVDPTAALKRNLGPLAAAGVTGAAIIALPVLLTVAMAGQSNRPDIDFAGAGRGSLHPALGLTFFAPDLFGANGRMWDYWGPPSYAWDTAWQDLAKRWGKLDNYLAQNMGELYIGAIPALLVLYGLGSGALVRREIVFFTGALGVMIVYALGWFTPVFWLFHSFVPGVSLFRRPADAVFLIGFVSAILAGYSLHVVLAQPAITSVRAQTRGVGVAAATTIAAVIIATGLAIAMGHFRRGKNRPYRHGCDLCRCRSSDRRRGLAGPDPADPGSHHDRNHDGGRSRGLEWAERLDRLEAVRFRHARAVNPQ
jgi:hypothetical protein